MEPHFLVCRFYCLLLENQRAVTVRQTALKLQLNGIRAFDLRVWFTVNHRNCVLV